MNSTTKDTRLLVSVLAACLLSIFPECIQAQVSVDEGDIVFRTTDGKTRRLTTSGLDSEPVLSPDGRQIVFVRDTPGETVRVGWGDANAKEIWIVNVDGSGLSLLIRGAEGDPWEKTLAALSNPRFLSDGKSVVFNSALAAVTGTVNAVDIESKTVRRITHGSLVDVVRCRKCEEDSLIVYKHKYFLAGGSYDWPWLVRLDGTDLDPIGPGEGAIEEYRKMQKWADSYPGE